MANVRMGVCNVSFDGVDLGHTKGGVKVSYKVESEPVETDQSDAPIDIVVTKQLVEATVPLVDYQLTKLSKLIPGCELIIDSNNPKKMRLEISGEAGSSLAKSAKLLTIKPLQGDDNDIISLYCAVPIPEFDLNYDKGTDMRIYNIRFSALKREERYVAFGDPTATKDAGKGKINKGD